MKYYTWNEEKNEILKIEREVGFADVVVAIESGGLLDIIQNPNPEKYPDQKMFMINIGGYVYLVPYVEDEEKCFLKTIFPSRKMTKKYLVKGGER